MRSITVNDGMTSILLGRKGENEATKIIFDISDWIAEYPQATFALINQKPNTTTEYPVVISQPKDGKVSWVVGGNELLTEGYGQCALEAVEGNVVAKKHIWRTRILTAMGEPGEFPEPWESWMTEFTRLKGEAEDAQEDAEAAAEDSEAWAVGQRNGEDVESDDPTYHNNSKYYSEAAQTALNTALAQAEAAADAAETAQGKAEDAQEAAEDAQADAEAAQAAAELAKSAAETAQGKAEDAQEAAEDAQAAAETAQGKAEDAQSAAETAQSAAAGYASAAYTSAGNAASSASDAAGSASDAEDAKDAAEAAQAAAEAAEEEAEELLSTKADKANPVFTGSMSMGRKAETDIGNCSVAIGNDVEAIAEYSHAEGRHTKASGSAAHAEGYYTEATQSSSHAEGGNTRATGARSHAEGKETWARGANSHSEGYGTVAHNRSQHVFGEYNVPDEYMGEIYRGDYIEIAGNGEENDLSNARALDWDGNEYLKGDLFIGCNDDSTGGKKVAKDEDVKEKAPVIIAEASGSIVSIPDGAGDMKVKKLEVAIEPVQDLHGYDNPWPAGGGKNLINKNQFISRTTTTVTVLDKGITVAVASSGNNRRVSIDLPNTLLGKTVTLHADVSVSSTNYARQSLSFASESDITSNIETINGTGSKTTTIQIPDSFPEGSTRIILSLYACTTGETSVGVSATYDNLQLELGSTATAYAPYENKCPISGWTSADVTRHGYGVNLFDTSKVTLGQWIQSGGNIATLTYCGYGEMIPSFSEKISFKTFGTNYKYGELAEYDENKGFIKLTALSNMTESTITLQNTTKYIAFGCGKATGTLNKSDIDAMQIMLCAGDIPTEFKAYDSTYTYTFPQSAGTVYGGTLTINRDGTGTLVVNRAVDDLGGRDWTVSSDNISFLSASRPTGDIIPASQIQMPKVICEIYKASPITDQLDMSIAIATSGKFKIRDSRFSQPLDTSAFKTAMNGIKAVYELAEPVSYDLTAQQVVSLLKGQNVLWSTTGPVSIEYPADTRLYIEKLTKPTEDDMIANNNIASGKFFMINNTLYLSSAAIASGEEIVPGTNCTEISLADALNNLSE